IFRRYIALPKGADIALALWVLHAWTYDAGDISPFMVLVSPTKRCGKTSVLILLLYLTPRSELASNISAAALFRYIEKEHPTLLIDEADSFEKDNEQLRGILNSGHTKTAANVIRIVEVNGDHQPHRFSTWAAKAIATIRSLADTLEDRAIIVQLQRKPPGAKVERLRKRDNEWFGALRSQAARWSMDNFDKLVDPDPQIPEALNDRAADNWRPLLPIADLAGGEWPQLARQACLTLSGESPEEGMGVTLLADCRPAFGDNAVIRSVDLVTKLIGDPERPWAEYNRGKPITQRQLARLPRAVKEAVGSLAWLIARYRQTNAWAALAATTRKQRENIFRHVIETAGDQPFAKIDTATIIAGRDRRASTPAQARNFLDAMRGAFKWAAEAKLVKHDPAVGVGNPPRKAGDGFIPWTEEHVAKYQQRWPIGTRQRVWLDVLLYSGLRRGDAVRYGRQHVHKGVGRIKTE